jgi:hypothetical protein
MKRVLLALACILAADALFSEDAPFSLGQTIFRGSAGETILAVRRMGFYSIGTSGGLGAAFQIVDRQIGPSEWTGEVGQSHGRMDVLLDEGLYKIRLRMDPKAKEPVNLLVSAFSEANSPEAPVLREGQRVEGSLKDRETASYWIELPADGDVSVEASGRALDRLTLLKEGSWLVPVNVETRDREILPGLPVRVSGFHEKLEKGLYLVVASAKEPPSWTERSGEFPFALQYGYDRLPKNARIRGVVPASGYAKYHADGPVRLARLSLPEIESVTLSVTGFSPGSEILREDSSESVETNSRLPETLLSCSYPGNGGALVTVSGKPGQEFTLETLAPDNDFTIRPEEADMQRSGGHFWVSTIHTGSPQDSIDASGFLLDNETGDIVGKSMPVLSSAIPWVRRFNLTDPETVFFDVRDAGKYRIEVEGSEAEAKFECFFVTKPRNYKAPGYSAVPFETDLDPGVYVLSLRPKSAGVVKATVRKTDLIDLSGISGEGNPEWSASRSVNACVQITNALLRKNKYYRLYVGGQGRLVQKALQLRQLPLDPSETLSVSLRASETNRIPLFLREDSLFNLSCPQDTNLRYGIDGKESAVAGTRLSAGNHEILLWNSSTDTLICGLSAVSFALRPDATPVFLSTESKHAIPKFDEIETGWPVFFDLPEKGKKVFLLRVKEAGIYAIRSLGLLKVKGTVRTRLVPEGVSAQANTDGRNFLIQTYLREGEYQLVAETLDRSAGHLGVEVRKSDIVSGGDLLPGGIARATVPSGSALSYAFVIPGDGNYRIQSAGVSGNFPCRVDDPDGWPVLQPGIAGDITEEFSEGRYSLISLPETRDTRRVSTLELFTNIEQQTGKGPIPLELNREYSNQYVEKLENGVPVPDRYDFRMTAPASAAISAADTMCALLLRKGEGTDWNVFASVYPDAPFSNLLPMGDYRLEWKPLRPDNYVDYAFTVQVDVLLPGMSRELPVPGIFPLSVGRSGLFEIGSLGMADVRAYLYGSNGELLDYNDDTENDWNFRITRNLEPGDYRLNILSRGGESAATTVSLREFPETNAGQLEAETPLSVNLRGLRNIFELPETGGFYLVKVSAASLAGAGILETDGGIRHEVFRRTGREIVFPVYLPGGPYRLALWSEDHQSEDVKIAVSRLGFVETLPGQFATNALAEGSAVSFDSTEPATYPVISSAPGAAAVVWSAVKTGNGLLTFTSSEDGTVTAGVGKVYLYVSSGSTPGLLPLSASGGAITLGLRGNVPGFVRTEAGKDELNVVVAGCPDEPVLTAFWLPDARAVETADGREFPPFRVASGVNCEPVWSRVDGSTAAARVGPGTAAVWDASDSGGSASVSVHSYRFPLGGASPWNGPESGTLSGKSARSVALPDSAGSVEIDLERGMAAAVIRGGRVTALLHSGDTARSGVLPSRGGTLVLANMSDDPGAFRYRCYPQSTAVRNGPVWQETVLPEGAEASFTVPSSTNQSSRVLRLSGSGVFQVLDSGGILHRFDNEGTLSLGDLAAFVTFTSAGGPLQAWSFDKAGEAAGRWGAPSIAKTGRFELSGWAGIASVPEGLEFKTDRDSVLSLRGDAPFAAAISGADGIRSCLASGGGEALEFLLRSGTWTAGVRAPLDGPTQPAGRRVKLSVVPAVVQTNTMGDAAWTGADGPAVVRFDIGSRRDVGVGVKADAESIRCLLFDGEGKLLKDGPVIFRNLEKGRYFVVFETSSPLPLRFVPVVVGLESIDRAVFIDQVREFLGRIGYQEVSK